MPAKTYTYRVTYKGRRHPEHTEVRECQAATAAEARKKTRGMVCTEWGYEASTRVSTERVA